MSIIFLGAYQDKQDNVQKYVFCDKAGIIEVTHIHNKDRDTYCIPSMYMCKLGCTFCHCTTEKLQGNALPISFETIKEILNRIPRNRPSVLYSIMGMGDPIYNLKLVGDLNEFCKPGDRVSISTIFPIKDGVSIPWIPSTVKIHYSLHTPFEEIRQKLIPAKTLPIKTALEYLHCHRQNNCEIHYTLINNVNDRMEDLNEMCDLLKDHPVPIKFLEFNETANFKKSNNLNIWMKTLRDIVLVEFYTPPGLSIGSSCGQFTRCFYNNDKLGLKEFENKYKLF